MFEITGKYGTANVYASSVEDECVKQIYGFMNSPVVEDCKVAIMPDCHAGKGACIGFTQEIKNRVNPNMVGVDIGCSMLVLKIAKASGDKIFNKPGLEKLDKVIRQYIPSGMKHRDKLHKFAEKIDIAQLIADADYSKEMYALGSLGGGNHFIEVDTDENGDYYIVIHSGSRHLGIAVAKYWEDRAVEYHKNNSKAKDELIKKLKAEGREKDIQAEIAKIPEIRISKEMSYLEGDDVDGYLHDMRICQEFARLSREAMLDIICDNMGIKKKDILDKFCTMHNYIDTDKRILRKGAISLQKDEVALIPGSMQFGSLIVKGKGNAEANFSGPHGFGRLMSRSKAKETLKMEDFKNAMDGIYTTCISTSTIDEAPMAYKPAESIIPNIEPMCEIVSHIHPIYNFKSSD